MCSENTDGYKEIRYDNVTAQADWGLRYRIYNEMYDFVEENDACKWCSLIHILSKFYPGCRNNVCVWSTK
jgi:hypothetical protein